MKKPNYQKLNSISVVIIALSAVVVAIWQTELTRQHNRRTVKPYLDIDIIFDDQTSLTIKNKGEGAALITYFGLELNGSAYSDWSSLFEAVDPELRTGLSRTFEEGDVIGAHEELILCSLPPNSPKKVDITLKIGYESIYGDFEEFNTSFSWGGGGSTEAETN